MHGIPVGAWLAMGGLIVLPTVCGSPAAQEPFVQDPSARDPSVEALIDRIGQIQDELEVSQAQRATPQGSEAPAAMQPEIGEEEMRTIVRESLGVEILRVEVVEHDGRPAYAITVMNPPGNRNDAYRVATLLFDGATGSLLGQESPAPRAVAPDLSTATTPSGFEGSGPEIRRRTWR